MLAPVLLGFASDARRKVGGHGGDSYGREDIPERGDRLSFNDFDSNVVDETCRGNIYEHITGR